jgi:hypothetical protein
MIGDMGYWILAAAVVGYHITYVLRFWVMRYHPEYPASILLFVFSPGSLFFHSGLLVGLANALVYGVIAYLVMLSVRQLKKPKQATP